MHTTNSTKVQSLLKPFTKNRSVTSTIIHVETLHIITAFRIQEATIQLHHFQQKPTATYAIEKINQLIKSTQLLTHITCSSGNIILTSYHHTFTLEKPNMSISSSTASTRVRSVSYKVYIFQCIIFSL